MIACQARYPGTCESNGPINGYLEENGPSFAASADKRPLPHRPHAALMPLQLRYLRIGRLGISTPYDVVDDNTVGPVGFVPPYLLK